MSLIEDTVNALGGIATRRQLMRRGFTGRSLTSAVLAGSIARVRKGWYASDAATAAQLLAVRVGGRISHVTAADSLHLWAGLDRRVHIALVRGQSRLRAPELPAGFVKPPRVETVLHWTETGAVDRTSSLTWRVTLDSCLRGVVRISDAETALACLETAITRFGLTSNRIESMFAAEPLVSRILARRARRGSDSGIESIFCHRFRSLGIQVRQQVSFAGIRRIDALLGRRVIIELDGREFHDQSKAFHRDRFGDAKLVALGYVVLRFSYQQVLFDWPFVERTVLAALAIHG